ncbi:MAG: hypothetical protein ACPL4N_02360 [Candidatus Norongarragalinales archaeon]|jgi:hypothetical protein
MSPFIALVLLTAAIFFVVSGEVFFAFVFVLLFAAGLLFEFSSSRKPSPAPQPPGMLGQTAPKAFGGEEEIGKRFGYFFNFFGALFNAFWNSFGREQKK